MIRASFQFIKHLFLIFICLSLSACYYSGESSSAFESAVRAAKAGKGSFNGTWNVVLNIKKDGCGLGIKSMPATIVIKQNGRKAKVTIQGLKSYGGSISGSVLSASGKYGVNGSSGKLTLTGSVIAKLSGTSKLKITSASLGMKGSGLSCKATFSGSGTRA